MKELDARRASALRLFEQRQLTLVQAARAAGTSPEDFIALLGEAGIPAVDYPPEDLDHDVQAAA